MDQCESDDQAKVGPDIYSQQFLNFTIPVEESSTNYLGQKNPYDGCTMFNRTTSADPNPVAGRGSCLPSDFHANDTVGCEKFVYDNVYFDETLTTKLVNDFHQGLWSGPCLAVANTATDKL